ncbi:hypothetical protein [Cognatishimia sp.]|uniref:hypothetical protein n=1 Tax=Cognatishimia sp. TaxID=2211648 RepID=UPI003513FD02|nr:hypothetical protein [Cognatishimia sp.]
MPLIIDPDDLNQGTEVTINSVLKTIGLNIAGNLSTDGVTLQTLYSFLKEEWKNDSLLIKFPFPMTPITNEQFELKDGWDFADDATRYLIRTGGWSVLNLSGNITQKWAGIVGLGSIESDDQLYFNNGAGATDFELTGQVNQAVQILSDPNGDGDFADGFDRSTQFTIYVREQAQIFGQSSLGDIGVTEMDSIAYRFPISTQADLTISTADIGIDANSDGNPDIAPYDAMTITYIPHQNRGSWGTGVTYAANDVVQSATDNRWYLTVAGGTSSGDDTDLAGGSDTGVTWVSFSGERQIGSDYFAFGVIIDGNLGTAEQIYEFIQHQLRQSIDIDDGAGTQVGNIADELLTFVGSDLKTLRQSSNNGVFIDNFQAADTNRLFFVDDTGTERQFPFVAVLTLTFNNNLQNDPAGYYRVFFEDANGNQYGDSTAILVDDNSGVDMTADISGSSSVQLDFDYDGNAQGGRTPGTDANIVVVAGGEGVAQKVSATGTITRSTTNAVSLVAPLERNFSNPA